MNIHSLPPIYVDLDGTLTHSDTLWDSFAVLIQNRPYEALLAPWHMAHGALHFKRWLARRALPNVQNLPYRADMVAWCKGEHERGRRMILATAAHETIAKQVASHLGFFDDIIATDIINRKGRHKLAAIQAHANGSFWYAGDAKADLAIWSSAAAAVVVGAAAKWDERRLGCPVVQRFADRKEPQPLALIKAMRPHQWVKNALVFVPLLSAHLVTSPAAWLQATLLFCAFCACASSVYLLNDLVDLDNDRSHHRKRRRPFAAGTLPVPLGMALAPLLLAGASILAWLISWEALGALAVYYIATFIYSFSLKKKVLIDVFALAGLYTIRAMAGAIAVDVPLSPWLMAFMVFLFLSLALGKRAAELQHMIRTDPEKQTAKGRGWRSDDLPFVTCSGVGAAFAAALVIGLYIAGTAAQNLYARPLVLWGLIPLILWWSCRVWLKAGRGELNEDPIVFALRDPASWAVAVLAAVLIMCAGPLGAQIP